MTGGPIDPVTLGRSAVDDLTRSVRYLVTERVPGSVLEAAPQRRWTSTAALLDDARSIQRAADDLVQALTELNTY